MEWRAIVSLGALAMIAGCETVPEVTYAALDGGSTGDGSGGDAGDDAAPGTDAPEDALMCVVPAGVDGGCCSLTIAPCVGLACQHCGDCATAACRPNQFCCAKLNGGGTYRGVMCSPDTTMCP
jgi:hypothetical protein